MVNSFKSVLVEVSSTIILKDVVRHLLFESCSVLIKFMVLINCGVAMHQRVLKFLTVTTFLLETFLVTGRKEISGLARLQLESILTNCEGLVCI